MNQNREQWGSRLGFILAAAGSAIGLGNIWMFPKTAGENGGGLFVLLYLLCVMVIGIPLMLAELAIGRASQSNAVGSFKKLSPGKPWFLTGGLGVLAGFLILSFYAVIGGWILIYLWDSITGLLTSPELTNLAALDTHFVNRTTDPVYSILFYFIFMALTIFIVFKGIGEGIEKWSKILMPVLLGLLILVIVRGLFLEGAMKGLEFLFVPRFEDFKPETLASALSQAFFSLSLGMGAMITYGSYLKKDQNLPQSAMQVGGLDTLIGVLAGMAIFPALLSINPDISASDMGGPGLIFKAFPQIFLEMFGGNALFAQIFAILFFVLVLIAALTSSISLLEVVTAYFVDEKKFRRSHASIIMGSLIFLIGIPSALFTGVFGFVSAVTYDYMLPIGGFFISIYAAWVWGRNRALIEIAHGCTCFKLGILWHFILRWIAPFVIFQILLGKVLIDLKIDEGFRNSLQTIFAYTDAVLIGGTLLVGIYFWFFKPASLVKEEE